jgi:hypothetical protein
MIKDTLLVCCLILAFVLLYRIYVVSQKINNLEEKFIILDNFSQTLFNYISTTNTNQQKSVEPVNPNIITYSNSESNQHESESDTESDSESDSESESEKKVDDVTNTNIGNIVESTENFDTKEILSDMVSQLKESIIQSSKENLSNELKEVDDLKESLETNDKDTDLKESLETNDKDIDLKVFNNSTEVEHTQVTLVTKKKEKDLQEMTMEKLKELAKKQNITISQGKKQKNKSELIKDLLASQ